jgi:hypothetical protein
MTVWPMLQVNEEANCDASESITPTKSNNANREA